MIVRRDFLKQAGLGAMASALVAGGHLPLLSAAPNDGAAKADYPIQMIRPWVRSAFRPAESADLDWEKPLALQYKLVNWLHRPPRRPKAKRLPDFGVVGSLRIKRTPGLERTIFGFVQESAAAHYPRRRLAGRFETGPSADAGLEKWNLCVSTVPGKKTVLVESGTKNHKTGDYTVGHGEDRWTLSDSGRPLVSRFALPFWFASMQPKRDEARRFDLLDDLTSVKPDQTLQFDRTFEIPVGGGKTVALDGWVQTGQAVLPIHYLVDQHGLVQLVTEGICCWALGGIFGGGVSGPTSGTG